MPSDPLLDTITTEQRLALAYAIGAARPVFLSLFALDCRLADTVRAAHEPMLGQIRLAWWRDRLNGSQPLTGGEPLLPLLAQWGVGQEGLVPLVDGWEAMLGEPPLDQACFAALAHGRGLAFCALARQLGFTDHALLQRTAQAGEEWALADLSAHLSNPAERTSVSELTRAHAWKPAGLPRALRPLTVLHGLAIAGRGQGALLSGPSSLLRAARLGLFGR